MDDQEICVAAMTEWLVEARPPRLEPSTSIPNRPTWCERISEGQSRQVSTDYAIALFESSGWKFWMDSGHDDSAYKFEGQYHIDDGHGRTFSAKTWLGAIHAAILSATHESKEE